MTNYPRDEFDRVPEFNTRVGSHHAHGWAQSAASKKSGCKLRWVVIAAVIVVVVGVVAYFFGPGGGSFGTTAAPTTTESSAPTQEPSDESSADESESASESESESAAASESIDESLVLYNQLVGVYNGANIAGIATAGQEALAEAGFTQIVASNWTRDAATSTVYYMAETDRMTAEKVASLLNIDEVLQTTNIPNRVTAVLGADDPLNVGGAGVEDTDLQLGTGTE